MHTGAPGGATVLGNLTVAAPISDGHVRLFACDVEKPNASSVNFIAGRSVANFAAIRTDGRGDFCVWTTTDTHILWDQVSETTALTTHAPLRKIDTRAPGKGKLPAEEVLKIATGAPGGSTVLGNLTVTQPASDGHVRAYPCDLDKPNASSLNFAAGRSVANFAAIRTDASGSFCVWTTTDTHILWDQVSETTAVTTHSPDRIIDTRADVSTVGVSGLVAAPEATAASLTWQLPPGATTVTLRRTPGDAPAASPTDGAAISWSANASRDTGLKSGTRYTYTVFARAASGRQLDPTTVTIQTTDAAGATWATAEGTTLAPSAAATGATYETPEIVAITWAPNVPLPRVGNPLVVPISPSMPGGLVGEVASTANDLVKVRQTSLNLAFDELDITQTVDFPDAAVPSIQSNGSTPRAGQAPTVRCDAVTVGATMSLAIKGVHFKPDWHLDRVGKAASFTNDIDADLEIRTSGSLSGKCRVEGLANIQLSQMVGPVPIRLALNPDIQLTGSVIGQNFTTVHSTLHSGVRGDLVAGLPQVDVTPAVEMVQAEKVGTLGAVFLVGTQMEVGLGAPPQGADASAGYVAGVSGSSAVRVDWQNPAGDGCQTYSLQTLGLINVLPGVWVDSWTGQGGAPWAPLSVDLSGRGRAEVKACTIKADGAPLAVYLERGQQLAVRISGLNANTDQLALVKETHGAVLDGGSAKLRLLGVAGEVLAEGSTATDNAGVLRFHTPTGTGPAEAVLLVDAGNLEGDYEIEALPKYFDAGTWPRQTADAPALGALQTVRWILDGSAGERVPVAAQIQSNGSGSYRITVRRPNGLELGTDTGHYGGYQRDDARLDVTLPESGRYTVELLNDSWYPMPTGAFRTTGLRPVDAGAWPQQVTYSPALGALQSVAWTLDGAAGQRVPVAAIRGDFGGSYRLTVRRPNGLELEAAPGYNVLDARLDVTLPEDGRYTVELLNDSWDPAPTGAFRTAGLLPVDAGAWKQQTTGAPALDVMQTATWTLDGRAGQRVPLAATIVTDYRNSSLTVRRPDGSVLDSRRNDGGMRLDVTLPEDGRYTVELHNSHWTPAPAGTFLTTGLLPVDAGAWIPQVNSTPALGALQTVRWTLEGTAGQRVLLAAQRTDSCGWNYSLALRRPNGVVIARDTGQFDDDARLDVTMPEDGRYTVELSNDTWLQLPAGTFSITGLPPVDAGA